jgi:hypothetical protein
MTEAEWEHQKKLLQKVCFAVHESGHICAACSRDLPVSAEIGIDVVTSIGRVGGMTWHFGGTSDDDLLILYAGIETSRRFGLSELGLLKDLADIEEIAATLSDTESAKERAQREAEILIGKNEAVLLKMGYALFQNGALDEAMTQKIYQGAIVTVAQEFLDTLDQISTFVWRLVA